jgi:hypothetical protein
MLRPATNEKEHLLHCEAIIKIRDRTVERSFELAILSKSQITVDETNDGIQNASGR